MKKILLILFSIVALRGAGQDIHFTMWDAMPITLNPATAGVFNGEVRSVLNYRSQWASVGNAYKTYAVMLDGGLFKNKWRKGYIGTGLNVYKDVAGVTNFGTTKVSLSLSSVVYLDENNTGSVGLMGAWLQNSMSPNNLEWDSQFNGQAFDGTLSSNESINFNSSNHADFSVGALWQYREATRTLSSHDEFMMRIGAAFYHLTRPSQETSVGDLDKLYSKLAIHGESFIGISNTKMALKPKIIAFFQGPARQYTAGLLFRYMLVEESKYTGIFKEMAIAFGGYYRFGDAFSPSVEFEMSSFSVGFAYDMNVSGLRAATGGRGGPEIFIRFLRSDINKRR